MFSLKANRNQTILYKADTGLNGLISFTYLYLHVHVNFLSHRSCSCVVYVSLYASIVQIIYFTFGPLRSSKVF